MRRKYSACKVQIMYIKISKYIYPPPPPPTRRGVPMGSKVCFFSGTKNDFKNGTKYNFSGTKINFSGTKIILVGLKNFSGTKINFSGTNIIFSATKIILVPLKLQTFEPYGTP